LALKRFYFK